MTQHRSPRERDGAYMAWVARLPCLACMVRGKVTWGVHVAHLRAGSEAHGKRPTGKAEKPSDMWTLPLCPPHHVGDVRVTRLTQHNMGELEFWAALGIEDPFQVCLNLYSAYRTNKFGAITGTAVISKTAAAARLKIEGALPMDEDKARAHYAALQASGELPFVALSIQQPWAWLMTAAPPHLLKRIENRTWRRKTPSRILVHAGQNADVHCHEAMLRGCHPVTGEALNPMIYDAYVDACTLIKPGVSQPPQLGGLVGVMDFTGEVLTQSDDPWFMGPYGYVTANARPLPFLPWRGMLGFFEAKVSA